MKATLQCRSPVDLPVYLPLGCLLAAVAVTGLWVLAPQAALLLAALCVLSALTLLGLMQPFVLIAALWLVAPFNYAHPIGPAVVRLSEGVTFSMALVVLARLVTGDRWLIDRIKRRADWLIVFGALGLMALATSAGRPNFFNVRFEWLAYGAFAYSLIFFQAHHWSWLQRITLVVLATESVIALGIHVLIGAAGIRLQGIEGGIEVLRFTPMELREIAGGLYRLAGTLDHKNLLAAFYILLLPGVVLELVRRGPHRTHPFAWAVLALSLVVLALTDSMTGWGALLLVALLAVLHLRRADLQLLAVLLAMPLAWAAIDRFGGSMMFRARQLLPGQQGFTTVTARMEQWNIGRQLVAEHAWLGIGRGNFSEFGSTFFAHAHNLYLMKIIEMGVAAGAAFTLVLLAAVLRIWFALLWHGRCLARHGAYFRLLGLWLGCVGFLTMNLFDYSYAHPGLAPLFMAILGIALASSADLINDCPQPILPDDPV